MIGTYHLVRHNDGYQDVATSRLFLDLRGRSESELKKGFTKNPEDVNHFRPYCDYLLSQGLAEINFQHHFVWLD